MIKNVFVYSSKRVDWIDEKHQGDKVVYAEPRFYNKPEYNVHAVYTNSVRIRKEYEAEGCIVEALVKPSETFSSDPVPLDGFDEKTADTASDEVVEAKGNDADDWRSLPFAKKRALCIKLLGSAPKSRQETDKMLEEFYAS